MSLLISEFRFSISSQLAVFSQRQSPRKKISDARCWLSSSTRITEYPCAQRQRQGLVRLDAFPIMNPLARTRMYTSVTAGAAGVRDGTDRAVGVASVMLQVQCISLPKRFVPSVSKCPSVVCLPPLTPLPFSLPPILILAQSARSPSPSPRSLPLVTVLLARTHPQGKRRANATPGS